MGLKNSDSCLEKTGRDEPIFVLRAQDKSAPRSIFLWLADNHEGLEESKIIEAVQCAINMRAWPNRKKPD